MSELPNFHSGQEIGRYWTAEQEACWQRNQRDRWDERQAYKRARLEKLEPQLEPAAAQIVTSMLLAAGLARNEARSELDRIAPVLRKALPEPVQKGDFPWPSFGLIGATGIGKSFALAAALRRHSEIWVAARIADLRSRQDADGMEALLLGAQEVPCHWISWPAGITDMRGRLFDQETRGEAEAWVGALITSPTGLILDDIGAERQTAGDWAGEILERIVAERLRWERPLTWTSNLATVDLAKRYGARLVSRLVELAPPIVLPGGLPDLRLAQLQKR